MRVFHRLARGDKTTIYVGAGGEDTMMEAQIQKIRLLIANILIQHFCRGEEATIEAKIQTCDFQVLILSSNFLEGKRMLQ